MIAWRLSLLLAVLGLVGGFWAGNAWQAGRTAIAQNAELRQQQRADREYIDGLKAAAQELREHAVDSALAYDQSIERQDAIANQLETHLEQDRQHAAGQRAALDALAAARPDLRDLRLGPDVLQHWRKSNAGRRGAGQPAAPAAAPRPAGEPAHDVPRPAAAGQRRGAGIDRQPRSGDGAVRRVPGPRRFDPGERWGMAGHRVALVLPGGGRNGHRS